MFSHTTSHRAFLTQLQFHQPTTISGLPPTQNSSTVLWSDCYSTGSEESSGDAPEEHLDPDAETEIDDKYYPPYGPKEKFHVVVTDLGFIQILIHKPPGIQLDGLKVENVSLKRRYDELSKANTHSRTAYTEKLSALTSENTKLKALVHGKTSSGPSTSEKPKVLASGMYTKSSKYIPPPKRANWVKPTPLPKKKQVTFQEPPRTSNRPTQKPPVQQNKKPNVPVNLSTRTKPATESRKPMPKCHTRNHRILPNKSVNARRAADHNRKLNVVYHNQFVIRSLKSVNTKTPHAKHSVNHTKKVWKATRNHNVNTTKTAWRPTGKIVGSVKPQWKPTGRHFALYDNCPLTRIVEPIVEPLELTPSVSSSSKVTKISRFPDCKLSDRKAGSKGISANWVKPTPLPKKKQVTFQEPPRTSNRPTQKPPVQQNKKPNVPVNLSTRTKPATESRKPMPKSHTRNHHILPNKSVNARRAAYHNRKLNVVDHNQFVIRSLTSVQTSSGLAPQQMTSVPNSTELELTALQSGRSRSALVKDPEPPSVPPTTKQVDDLFQWFDDDEVIPPPSVPIPLVNTHAAQAPENAIGSPSTTVISEGAPVVTESLLPHQIPLPDNSDSDIKTVTPPKIQQCSGIPHGVLLHNTQR
ncbi:hypothetical protein Tco_0745253 [Tanacetum coccineum]